MADACIDMSYFPAMGIVVWGAVAGLVCGVGLLASAPRLLTVGGAEGVVESAGAGWSLWCRGAVAVASVVAASVVAASVAAGADPIGWAWFAFVVLAATAPVLAWVDVMVRRLPFVMTVPLAGIGLLLFMSDVAWGGAPVESWWRSVSAAAVVGATFLVLALVFAGDLGFGDVVLAAVIGLYLGWIGWGTVMVGLFAGLALAALAGGVVWLVSGSAAARFALGPYLLIGAFVGIVAG